MSEPSCATCRYMQRNPIMHHMGTCRRYPPGQVRGEPKPPNVWLDGWCGEYQPKETDQ